MIIILSLFPKKEEKGQNDTSLLQAHHPLVRIHAAKAIWQMISHPFVRLQLQDDR
jgi:hypothetical protein